ncbi:MAG: hypothetical protein ACLUOI_19160 [Eisenbergiella sp.]
MRQRQGTENRLWYGISINRKKREQGIRKAALKVAARLQPARTGMGLSERQKQQDDPAEADRREREAFAAPVKKAAMIIGGYLYSLIAPVLLFLAGILLAVALLALLVASAFTVVSASVAETAQSFAAGRYTGVVPYYNQGDYRDTPFNDGTVASDGWITSFAMAASG